MQTQRFVYPIDLTSEETMLEEMCKKLGLSKADAIRDSVEYYYHYVKGLKVIELRNVSKNHAKKEVLEYLKKNKKAWTDEIADDLRIDVVLVNEILHELAEEGRVK